ncbi:methyltransferase domain-containing protein [Patescibacteria group bacterium]|nr:methyltransferase domain-containing protein [Patescibacteria group bacterium]
MADRQIEKEYWKRRKSTEYRKGIGSYAVVKDAKIITNFLEDESGSALDFPCGEGRHSLLLKSLGFTVVSADINNSMLEATKILANTKIINVDVFETKSMSEKYDVVLVSRLLFHYDDTALIISNLSRLVKNDGIIIFDTLNKLSLRWIIHKLLLLIMKPLRFSVYYRHERSLTFVLQSQVLELVKPCSLQLVKKYEEYIFPTRLYRFLPNHLISVFNLLQSLLPGRFRVLTYWKFRKIGRDVV